MGTLVPRNKSHSKRSFYQFAKQVAVMDLRDRVDAPPSRYRYIKCGDTIVRIEHATQ